MGRKYGRAGEICFYIPGMKHLFSMALLGLGLSDLAGQTLPIASIQGNTSVSPYVDSTVTILAFVTEAHGENWYMQDAYGAWNGIRVIGPDLLVPSNPPWWTAERPPETGDYLEISGVVAEVGGNTEIHDAQLVDFTDFWMATPSGVTVTGNSFQNEQYEGTRVRMEQVTVVNGPDANWVWSVTDGVTETICVGVDTDDPTGSEDPDGPTPGDVYKVYGTSLEVDGTYVLHISDIDVISLSTDNLDGSLALAFAPNPVVDFVTLSGLWAGAAWQAFDAQGRLIDAGNFTNNRAQLDARTWPVGLITVVVAQGNQTSRGQFLKI
jgi:hypothetical protein